MTNNARPIQFREYLPDVYRADEVSGVSFLSRFLRPFEALFEEFEAEIEGAALSLEVRSVAGPVITVAPFNTGAALPVGASVANASKGLHSRLAQLIPANQTGLTQITVADTAFAAALHVNDFVEVRFGGIPELFNPDTTPPAEFTHRPLPDFAYLNYLASWLALPLRAEKSVAFNRAFFDAAVPLYIQHSTLPGTDALLRAWLKGDLLEVNPPLLVLTDLGRTYNDIKAIFQLAPDGMTLADALLARPREVYAQLGVNTGLGEGELEPGVVPSLGEGAPFFFIADLITDPSVRDMRNPFGLDVFQRAARLLLDLEKPAHTYYQLRVRATTMQLAPALAADEKPGEVYAQLDDPNPSNPLRGTAMLFEEPLVFDSDC